MPIRVILADDHLIVRQGLRLVLEKEHIEVLGEASDGLEAIRLIQQLRPEIAVLDLDMPGLDFVKIAEGMGCNATRVTASSELAPTLKRALLHRGTTLVDVMVDSAVPVLYSTNG